MGKSKSAKPAQAAQPIATKEVKQHSAVKKGAITKPSQSSKVKNKEVAKEAATKANGSGKKTKKVVKEPSPEDSDMSDASSKEESDEDESSASSASSDEGSDEEPTITLNGAKPTSAGGVLEADSSDSSESSGDEDEANVKAAAPKQNGQATAGKKIEAGSEEDSEDGSEDESDEDTKPNGAIGAKAVNGKQAKAAAKKVSSDLEDSDDASASSASTDSDSDSDEESEEEAPAPKKRKAEEVSTPAAKKVKSDPSVSDDVKRNLFVGQLSWNVDEEWLQREFEEFGEIESVSIIYDRQSGRSKGFGYVKFVDAACGEKAKESKHRSEMDGRTINVDFNQPRDNATPRQDRAKKYGDSEPSAESATLFVANLAFDATNDIVGEAFAPHGDIISVRLPTDKDSGNPKGFGYVEFSSVEDSKKAFGAMSGASILGRPIRLDYSTPRPPRDSPGGFRGGRGGGDRGGRGGFDRGGRGGGRGRGGFDRGGRGGNRGGGRGGSTNRGGFGDFQGKKMTF